MAKRPKKKKTTYDALTPAQMRKLTRLKQRTDKAYRNFWLGAMILRPPKPPKIEPVLSSLGSTVQYLFMILRPPKPPK